MGLITFGKVLLMGVQNLKFWITIYTLVAI
jgi:hypothetical protein